MENRVVPSLSDDGWVVSSALRANYLLTHFFLSEYSQTALYPGNVASLPYIIQQNQGDPTGTATAIRATLASYFTQYFKNVDTQVDFITDPNNNSKIQIRIYMSFADEDGVALNLAKIVNVENSKVADFANLNNNGPAT